jgi:raffinose/stachyose/melibiose transport system permease protein
MASSVSTRHPTQAPGKTAQSGATGRKRPELAYYLMLLPAVAAFTLFITVPAVVGIFYSFTNYVGYGHWHFIGLVNYEAAFTDPNIRHSYGFTLIFAITTTVLVNVVGLLIALGLNSKIKLQKTFRAIYFLPMVISGLVIAYVFNYLFSTSIPMISSSLGLTPFTTSILTSSRFAWLAIVFVSTWQALPSAIIIYLAGLTAIPGEVYEAAAIDGSTTWDKFRHITLPLVLPFVVINSVLALKGFLNVYDVVVGLTNGGPGTSTQSVAMSIFTGFTGGDYAYQMANAVLFFIVTVLLSLMQLVIIRRRGGALA